MKKIFLFVCLFALMGATALAQNATTSKDTVAAVDTLLPFQKDANLPAFKIQKMDSSGFFHTADIPAGQPTALILFMTDCSHCQFLITTLLKAMDSLSNIQFYMVSPKSLTDLRDFYEKYHLARYPNIKLVGRDLDFFFYNWFGVKFVPYLALYDKNKRLLKGFDKAITVKELYKLSHQG